MKKSLLMVLMFLAAFEMNPAVSRTDYTGIKVTQAADGLYKIFVNDFVNIMVFSGPEGVLLVDSGFSKNAGELRTFINSLDNGDVKYLINTHPDYDHVDGNPALAGSALIISHLNCRNRLLGYLDSGHEMFTGFDAKFLPALTIDSGMTLWFNREEIELIYLPGHTDSDLIVYFKKARIAYLGDAIIPSTFPVVHLNSGGRVENLIKSVKQMMDIFPPDTKLIAGHGPDIIAADLKDYYTMLTGTVHAVSQAFKAGKSLEKMKRDNILKDWEQYSGTVFEEGTAELWIETIYQDLNREAPAVS